MIPEDQTPSVRIANAEKLRDEAASATPRPILPDGRFWLTRPDDPVLNGSLVILGIPGWSELIIDGDGSQVRLFEVGEMSRIVLRGTTLRHHRQDVSRANTLFRVEGAATVTEWDIEQCRFANIRLMQHFHEGSTGGFETLRFANNDIENQITVAFANISGTPFKWVRVFGSRLRDIGNIQFDIAGNREQTADSVVGGSVEFAGINSVNRRGLISAPDNEYLHVAMVGGCDSMTVSNCTTQGLVRHNVNSEVCGYSGRSQRVEMYNVHDIDCYNSNNASCPMMFAKGGVETRNGVPLSRKFIGCSYTVNQSHMLGTLEAMSDGRELAFLVPFHLSDVTSAGRREAESTTIIGCSWDAPGLRLRNNTHQFGSLTFCDNTLRCDRLQVQGGAALLQHWVGERSLSVNIDNNRVFCRDADPYPIYAQVVPAGQEPIEHEPTISYTSRNLFEGGVADGIAEAPAVQPVVVHQIEVEGSQMVTKSDFEMFKGANLDVLLPGSMPSGDRTVRFRATTKFGTADAISLDGLEWTPTSVRIVMDAGETAEITTGGAQFTRMFYRVESVGSDPDDVARTHYGEVRVNA